MDIKQLQIFISLSHTLNFTKSAELMYISQPALSKQIVNLEDELGVQLFMRDSRGVELTNAGKAFLSEAEKIVVHINKAIKIVKQSKESSIGSFSIGIIGDNTGNHYTDLLHEFRKKYPNINLVFSEYTASGINHALNKGIIDVAFAFRMDVLKNSDITWKTILEDRLCFVVHQDHPLSCRESVNLKELENEEFILVDKKDSANGHNEVVQMCLNHGFTPNVIFHAHFIPSLISLIACGVGVSILPYHAVKSIVSQNIRFISLQDGHAHRGIDQVVAWSNHNENPFLKYFIDEVNNFSKNKTFEYTDNI